jgi:hypothetical protein
MALTKLTDKLRVLGTSIKDFKITDVYKKINEIIDYLNGTGTSGDGSYKTYVALLTQSGTSAPTATVLQNTLGVTPTLSYVGVGTYRITATGIGSETRSFYGLSGNFTGALTGALDIVIYRVSDNVLEIYTADGGSGQNGVLLNTSLEIRLYN